MPHLPKSRTRRPLRPPRAAAPVFTQRARRHPGDFLDHLRRAAYERQHPSYTHGAAMPGTDKRKQSLYFPEDMLNEIQMEANRQDRSLSWIVQQAWKIARSEILRFPSVNDVLSGVAREDEREERERSG
jgi:uncharacterized small protein (TIGR04563 family)